MEFIAQLFETIKEAVAPAAASTQTIGGSPFVYKNETAGPVTVLISGGTVLDISIKRGNGAWMLAGLLAGQYMLAAGDSIQIGFLLKPNVTVVPL